MNITCIICSELFISGADIQFTQCGHVFHYHCLINWLERSKTCPQCRSRVTEKTIHKVYFNILNNESNVDATTLIYRLDSANFTLSVKEKEIKNIKEKKQQLKEQNRLLRQEVSKLENSEKKMEATLHAFKDQISYFKTKSKEADKLSAEILKLKNKIKDMEHIEIVINGNKDQVNDILKETNCTESIALLVVTLKKSLLDSEKRVRHLDTINKKMKNELSMQKKKFSLLESQNAEIRTELKQILIKNMKEKNILTQRLQLIKSNSDKNNIVVANPDAGSECSEQLGIAEKSENENTLNNFDSSLANTTVSVEERVQTIINSDSPYLNVKSNFGPFLNTKFQAPCRSLSSKPLRTGYSIFKTKHKLSADAIKGTKSCDVDYDGLGGSSKEDVFPTAKKQLPGMKRNKSSSSITTCKFRKVALDPSAAKVTEFFKSDH